MICLAGTGQVDCWPDAGSMVRYQREEWVGSQPLRISPPEVEFRNTGWTSRSSSSFSTKDFTSWAQANCIPHLSVVSPQVSADDQNQAEEKDKDEKSNHLVPTVTKVTLASLQLSDDRPDVGLTTGAAEAMLWIVMQQNLFSAQLWTSVHSPPSFRLVG